MTTAPINKEWRLDPIGARNRALHYPRDPGAPPHWMRCEWMRGAERCILPEPHLGVPHQGPLDKK